MENKMGQIAIWVILSLVIIGAISLFFLVGRNTLNITGEVTSPEQYIESCTKDATVEVTEIIIPQGGFLEPSDFKVYNDTKVSYLCKNEGSFLPCVNQHPLFIREIGNEIKEYISPRVENCFESMKIEVEGRGGTMDIGLGEGEITVSLAPGQIFVEIARDVKITEQETTRTFDKFDARIEDPVYDLARVAMNVAENEKKYCFFEYVGYMALDRNIDIKKFAMSDSTKIYSIEDRASGKIFNTAMRGCAIPTGI